jgi:hypothetical protein
MAESDEQQHDENSQTAADAEKDERINLDHSRGLQGDLLVLGC